MASLTASFLVPVTSPLGSAARPSPRSAQSPNGCKPSCPSTRRPNHFKARPQVLCQAAAGEPPSPSPAPAPTPEVKRSSILCPDCEGNGSVECKQCQGGGVNLEDHFQGRFKAGSICWLCRGKKNVLCGNCNGAGFIGGFMNAED